LTWIIEDFDISILLKCVYFEREEDEVVIQRERVKRETHVKLVKGILFMSRKE